jgi:hypothetical protein
MVSIDTIGIDPLIIRLKLSRFFSGLAIFTLITIVFLEVGRFFVVMAKNSEN